MNLSLNDQKVLNLIRSNPEIVGDRKRLDIVAKENGLTENALEDYITYFEENGFLQQNEILNQSMNHNFGDIDLFRLGQLIWSSKYEIIRNVFIVSVLSVILAFMLPKTFRASAVLMPPSQGSTGGILSTLSELPFGNLMNQSGDESMRSLAVLKSRSVMESIVEEYDLVNIFGCDNIEEAVKVLRDNVAFAVEDEGTIKISTTMSTSWLHPDDEEDAAKKLSADIANSFVEELDIVSKALKSQQASFQRRFIEGRYNQNIEDLEAAENRLKMFQEEHNMISLPEQTRVAIETAAAIKGQVLANEVRLGVMHTTLNEGHPDMELVKQEIKQLNLQLNTMDVGVETEPMGKPNLFPIFSQVPELGVELMRLSRDVEIQNTLFIFLTQQYEEAKIKEAKDTPTVQILDSAVPIHKKFKPSRFKVLLIGFVFSTIGSMYYVYFRKRYQLATQK